MTPRFELPVAGSDGTYPVQPGKIIAMGRNYLDHIAEQHKIHVRSFDTGVPSEPVLFPKATSALIAHGETIVLPAFIHHCGFDTVRTHYEAELAFFIADRCKHVPPNEAYRHIAGFTCANDVSQRNIQDADPSGWFRGKSLDTFCPIGPCFVPRDALPDPQALAIRCRLNGATVQDANTRDMIFGIPEIVAYVSMNFTLEPGDLILTGTPAGVGELAHGDVVAVDIESIGTLRNPVADERQ